MDELTGDYVVKWVSGETASSEVRCWYRER